MKLHLKPNKTSSFGLVLKLETFSDKIGNFSHVVTIFQCDTVKQRFFFVHLSSALDFINSNFQ